MAATAINGICDVAWSVSVCLSVSLSIRAVQEPPVQISPNYQYDFVVVLWWRYNPTLRTSGFEDDVMFSYNAPYGGAMLLQQPCCSVVAR